MTNRFRRNLLTWFLFAPFSVMFPRQLPAKAADPATQRFLCTYNECDPYVYDPVKGDPDNINGEHPIPPGVAFEDLPDDWLCPVCGSPKSYFVETEETWTPS